jgi:dephospho-CoA kinase
MCKKIAITGGIGSGKSTLSKILAKKGYCVWDADLFSREVLFFPEVQARIKTIFGDSVFINAGVLNRDYIRNQVFSKPKLKKSLESILHPAILELYNSRLEVLNKIAPSAWVFYEASLILELKRQSSFDFCIVVVADESVKLKRLEEKRKISVSEAKKIIHTQMPDSEKITHADFVIDNSKSFQNLEKQTHKLILHLTKRFSHN